LGCFSSVFPIESFVTKFKTGLDTLEDAFLVQGDSSELSRGFAGEVKSTTKACDIFDFKCGEVYRCNHCKLTSFSAFLTVSTESVDSCSDMLIAVSYFWAGGSR
jgi:hypothetical protein